jgi:hypothetical protein
MKRQGGAASILRKSEEKLQELGPAIEANEMKPLELKIKIETEHKKVDINISDEEMKMVHFYFLKPHWVFGHQIESICSVLLLILK